MSIFDIEPHKVSRDLRGYSVMFYGEPKSGKTTTAVQFPNHLLLAFEKGYAAIPGAMAKPINRWTEFLSVMRDLRKDEAVENFETIIVDTADIAWDLCEAYICAQNDVDSIGDMAFGKGYGLVAQEFDSKLREITQLGYGLVLISHAVDKVFTDEHGIEFNQIVPTLPKRANTIVSRMCDIIGYSRAVETEEGLTTKLFMRGTPRYIAGSRFPDTPDFIDFTYGNLVGAIGDAVDKLEERYGKDTVTKTKGDHNRDTRQKDLVLEEILEEFNLVAGELIEKDEAFFKPRIQHVVESHFGKGRKISEATLQQVDLANLVLDELKELLK